MAVRVICTIADIVTNADNPALVNARIQGCIIGERGTFRKGRFILELDLLNPDATAAAIRTGIDNAVRAYLTTKGVIFAGPDTVRVMSSIT